jgi:predicted transglutaminase-like cysteine proteinase
MKRLFKVLISVGIFVIMAAISACSTTAPTDGKAVSKSQVKAAQANYVPESRRALEPFSHVVFCHKYPQECVPSSGPELVELTPARASELDAVNRGVNSQIRPKNDSGDDVWQLSPQAGDCEDYAITKRHVLIQHGWPASALRLAEGYTSSGEGHLALVVRTSKGDIVLDNISNSLPAWNRAGLRWLTIQSSGNPRVWNKISGAA